MGYSLHGHVFLMFVVNGLGPGQQRFIHILLLPRYFNQQFVQLKLYCFKGHIINEPPHGKTNNLHMRKQRRRSASQLL